ncbi:MAG: hypothetical protein Q8P68_05650 [Candidatus Peregrinibacteria bacterium]|nr:hypothetical protein [Candidatus Peregrinibacteria bacterium]MDZ4245007.1 hypothetical protein [Candidatus Gracilibacteria bacterium]
MIFLDTCFWTKFVDGEKSFKDLVVLLARLVAEGKVHVVVNGFLLSEIAAIGDDAQVDTIFNLIQKLSSNVYMRRFVTILELEFDAQKVIMNHDTASVSHLKLEEIFGCFWESVHAFEYESEEELKDMSIEDRDYILRGVAEKFYADLPINYSKTMLRECGRKFKVAMQDLCKKCKNDKIAVLQKAILDAQKQSFASFLVKDTAEAIKMLSSLPRASSDKEEAEVSMEKIRNAYCSRSTHDGLLLLLGHFKRNKGKHLKSNDIYDTLNVGTVIPYCDMIFCDLSTRNHCMQSGLDKKFQVEIYSEREIDLFKQKLEQL